MFEKFRLKKLSKIVQSVVSDFLGQITKKDYFSAFSKINFLNIENIALLYEKNKNRFYSKKDKLYINILDIKIKIFNCKKL